MEQTLKGKTALVTGGSRGLGRAMAQELARLGALVALNYANNDAAAQEAVASIEAAGGEAFLIKRTLGSFEAAEAVAEALDRELLSRTGDPGLDILINNAGGGATADLDATTPEIFEQVLSDNLRGPFYLTKVMKPRLRQDGRIIFVSSVAARKAFPQVVAYALCKSAIETFTAVVAKELGSRGVTVNCIAPGLIASDANESIRANPASRQFFEENTLLKRIGEPTDISGVALALISPQMSFVTGQVIEVSGGLFA